MRINNLTILLIVCGAMLIALAVYTWRRRATPGALAFAGFLLAVAVYTLGYGIELASPDLPTMLFWSKVQYLGIVNIPALWLVFVLQYTVQEKWLTRRTIILLFIIPAITLGLDLTNDLHRLIYRAVELDTRGAIPLLAITRGPWYWVNAAFAVTAIVGGVALLWRKRLHSPLLYRKQATFMVAGSLIPLLAYGIHLSGLRPFGNIDLNPLAFTVVGGWLSWGMFRYRLFDLTPIAREALIENLRDGVVVLDGQRRIVDVNQAAQQIFDWAQIPVGKSVAQIWQTWPDLLVVCTSGAMSIAEIKHDADGTSEFYDVNLTTLQDQHGHQVGQLIVAHNITARKTIEQELQQAKEAAEAANRELRKAWSELERIAATDRLTGVYNRRKFEEIIISEMSRVGRYGSLLSLIMFDIDYFKQINDSFGHDAGDAVLVELARIVAANIRQCDALVRWGGEEFILLTPGIQLEQALQLAERTRTLVAKHNFPIVGGVTISLGVAQYDHPESPESLVKRADTALYRAKQSGRNRSEAMPSSRDPTPPAP